MPEGASHSRPDPTEFISFVDDCWIWTGPTANQTPRVHVTGRRYTSAIRITYEYIYDRALPQHYQFRKCQMHPLCVNPDHTVIKKTAAQLAQRNKRAKPLAHLPAAERKRIADHARDVNLLKVKTSTQQWNDQGVLTVTQVAQRYNLARSTILMHLKSGALKGFRENDTQTARWFLYEKELPEKLPPRKDKKKSWVDRSVALVDQMWGRTSQPINEQPPPPQQQKILQSIKSGKKGGKARWVDKSPEEKQLYSLYMRSARQTIPLTSNDIDRAIAHVRCGRTVGLRVGNDRRERERLRKRVQRAAAKANIKITVRVDAQKRLLEFWLRNEGNKDQQ